MFAFFSHRLCDSRPCSVIWSKYCNIVWKQVVLVMEWFVILAVQGNLMSDRITDWFLEWVRQRFWYQSLRTLKSYLKKLSNSWSEWWGAGESNTIAIVIIEVFDHYRALSSSIVQLTAIFRCASISWFQVVTKWVSHLFLQLAHLRVFQIFWVGLFFGQKYWSRRFVPNTWLKVWAILWLHKKFWPSKILLEFFRNF